MVMKGPLLSVIVPVYNTAPWLRKCLDSICNQTYRNLEIICVNDGSTDNSAEILAEYAAKDARVRVITQENAGVSVARNRALAVAQGVYVTGVDSDDYLVPHAYETLLPYLAERPDMLCFGVQGVDEEGKDCSNDYMKVPCEGLHEPSVELLGRTNGFMWNKLFRMELLRQHKVFFPEGMRYEDSMFVNVAAMQSERICYVSEPLYCYLQTAGSFTNARYCWRVFDACPMLEALYRYMQEHGLMPRWRDLYRHVFMEFYENPVGGLPGRQQRKAKLLYRDMVLRTGLDREYPGEYPFAELARFNMLRSLFFWRNKTTKLYKFLRWPVLRVEEMPGGTRQYHWFSY